MKTKIFLIAGLLAVLCTACETNEPIEKQLIGRWSEPYHVKDMITSITFRKDGSALYQVIPDTTVLDKDDIIYPGDSVNFNYSVIGSNKLHCYYDETFWNLPIESTTTFRIIGDTLIIDSLSLGYYHCNGLRLGKQ
ncbi:MAG: hypothetical protein IK073_08095 [Paludibacteraceae bacterium]|nr:hypothetical protein [Paludibacteraceae bacterium]